VQACHAAIAATNTYGSPHHQHPYLVLCAVGNEAELNSLFNDLKERQVPVCGFYEEDMRNELTAIATGPLAGRQRKPLKQLKLLE
jgi:hypothetical protein